MIQVDYNSERTMDNYANKILAEELCKRKQRNPSYSLRAFARDLDINPSGLSEFMASKRDFSVSMATRVARHLPLNQHDFDYFVISSQCNRDDNENAKDYFELMSYWHYFAILNLAGTSNNFSDPEWLAERLALEQNEIKQALQQLTEMGLIRIVEGRMIRNISTLQKKTKIPGATVSKHYRSLLSQAGVSLFRDPPNLREMRAITFAIDPDKIQIAKDILLEARDRITSLLTSNTPSAIYMLSYYLYPMRTFVKVPNKNTN